MPRPQVSVIVPSFNHAPYVLLALDSAVRQSIDVQLVVIDDASTDASPSLLQQWSRTCPGNHKLILHSQNVGLCATLNEGLEHCDGRYVATLASDDAWLPSRLAYQIAQLERADASVAAAFGDAAMIDTDGQPLGQTFSGWVRADFLPQLDKLVHEADGDLFPLLLRHGNFLCAPAALIRKEVLDAVGGWDASLPYEDFDMWLRITERHRVLWDPTVLVHYRVVPSSLSTRSPAGFPGENAFIYRKFIHSRWPAPYLARRALLTSTRSSLACGEPSASAALEVCRQVFGRTFTLLEPILRWDAQRRGRDLMVGDDPRAVDRTT